MVRSLAAGALIRDQLDFYFPTNSKARLVGVQAASLLTHLFFNNEPLMWPLYDGTTVVDASISAGTIYFNEISFSPGYYAVRFFPDKIGFWRLIVANPSIATEQILAYDIHASSCAPNGLQFSFTS